MESYENNDQRGLQNPDAEMADAHNVPSELIDTYQQINTQTSSQNQNEQVQIITQDSAMFDPELGSNDDLNLNIRFYCYHECFEDAYDFQLVVKIGQNNTFTKKYMYQIDEEDPFLRRFIFCDFKMSKKLYQQIGLNYHYEHYSSVITSNFVNLGKFQRHSDEISRIYSKFKGQQIFFDTPKVFKSTYKNKFNTQQKMDVVLSNYYQMMIKTYQYELRENHQDLNVLKEFITFQHLIDNKSKMIEQFREFSVDYLHEIETGSSLSFIISMIGVIMKNRQYLSQQDEEQLEILAQQDVILNTQLHKEFKKIYYYSNQYGEARFQDLEEGLRQLIYLNPCIGVLYLMEFDNFQQLKENILKQRSKEKFMRNLNKFVSYQVNELQKCDCNNLAIDLAKFLLEISDSLRTLIMIEENVACMFDLSDFQQQYQSIKERHFKNKTGQYYNWLAENIKYILKKHYLKKILKHDIIELVNNPTFKNNQNIINVIKDHPDLLQIEVVIQMVSQYQTREEFNSVKKILIEKIKSKQSVVTMSDYIKIMQIILEKKLSSAKSIQWCFNELKEHRKDEIGLDYKKQIQDFNEQSLLDTYYKVVYTQLTKLIHSKNLTDNVKSYYQNYDKPYDQAERSIFGEAILNLIKNMCKSVQDLSKLYYSLLNQQRDKLFKESMENLYHQIVQLLITNLKIDKIEQLVQNEFWTVIIKIGVKHPKLQNQYLNGLINNQYKVFKEREITLSSLEQLVKENRLQQIIDIFKVFFEKNYDDKIFQELQNILQKYKTYFDKYNDYYCFITHAEKLVELDEIKQDINKIQNQYKNVLIKNINNENYESPLFESLSCLHIIQKLRYSKVFQLCFKNFLAEISQNLKDEEIKEEEDQIGICQFEMVQTKNLRKLSILEFDNLLFNYLKNGEFSTLIDRLRNYPTTKLYINDLTAFNKLDLKDIQSQLNVLNSFLHYQNSDNNQHFSSKLTQDLSKYAKIQEFKDQLQHIIKLDFILRLKLDNQNTKLQVLNDQLKILTNFEQGKLSLNQIIFVLDIFGDMLVTEFEKYNIKMDNITSLHNTEQLMKQCLSNPDQDYNYLYESLDDDTLLNNTFISDMNQVNLFFLKLDKALRDATETSIIYLLNIINRTVDQFVQKDKIFHTRLHNCSENIQQIQTIQNLIGNTTENTIQVIYQVLETGKLVWSIKEDKCDLMINYDGLKKNMTIDNEKINSHSGKAILLSHNKHFNKQDEYEKIQISNAEHFTSIVALSQNLCQLITELFQNGHLEFQRDYRKLKLIRQEKIIFNLKKQNKKYEQKLKDWKKFLFDHRTNYYVMSYFPNSLLQSMVNYFSNPQDKQAFQRIAPAFRTIFDTFDFHSEVLKLEPLNQNLDCEGQITNLGQQVEEIFEIIQNDNQDNMFFDINLNEKTQNILRNGGVQIYNVNSSLDNIKAIASIFSVSKYYPKISQIHFCSKNTKVYEVVSFIQRAVLAPMHIKQQRIFVLSNFQKLQMQVQIESYKYLQKLQKQNQNNNKIPHYLYILITQEGVKNEYLIDEMQVQDNFTDLIIQDQYIQRFFSVCKANLVTSDSAGLGKSLRIQQQLESQKQNKEYIRIPIQGQMSKEKIIKIHQQIIQDKINLNRALAIHYDIYPTLNEDLNIIMFELLLFKGINNGHQQIYDIQNDTEFHLELSQEVCQDHEKKYFFKYLKSQQHINWNINDLQIDQNPQSRPQLVLRSINLIQKGARSVDRLRDKKIFNSIESAKILQSDLLRGIEKPNFYMIQSYFAFAGDQLIRILESYNFTKESLEFAFQGQGEQFCFELISAILEFSKKLTITNQQMLHTQQELISNDQISEEQLDKDIRLFQQVQNDSAFITINDDGTITPIFRRESDLPSAMRLYYNNLIQQSASTRIKNRKDSQDLLQEYQRETSSFESMKDTEAIDKIFRICSKDLSRFHKEVQENKRRNFDPYRIVFTADNFLKMNLIYLRIRAKQVVTIMGETGVGKTVLIEYLKDVLNWQYAKLNIHEGVTEEKIIDFTDRANLVASGRIKA